LPVAEFVVLEGKIMKQGIAALILTFGVTLGATAQAAVTGIGAVIADDANGVYTVSNKIGALSDADIEATLGLATGTLDGIQARDATEGSAIYDSLYVEAGDTFSFDWEWTSDEAANDAFLNDFAFYSLSLGDVGVLADTSVLDGTTGTFTWTANGSGYLTYGVGVMDVFDGVTDSRLTVSNISHVSAVPEPATLTLFGIGLAGLAGARLRRRAAKKS
jgi:hypothetical protein